jgi:hypothetical protein
MHSFVEQPLCDRGRLFLHGGPDGPSGCGAHTLLLITRDVGLLGSWVSVVLINSMLNSAFVT